MGGRGASYNNKNKIKIIKETNKALLVQKGQVQAWVQKRWLREDGTLTNAGEKALKKNGKSVAEIKKTEKSFLKYKELKKNEEKELEKKGVVFTKWIHPKTGEERIYLKSKDIDKDVSVWLEKNEDSYYIRSKTKNYAYDFKYYYQDRKSLERSSERLALEQTSSALKKFAKKNKIKVPVDGYYKVKDFEKFIK